jgi:hypothetical protein
VISLYTIIPKSVITSFNIFISIIIVAEFRDVVVKFAVINVKIPIINIFLAYNIRPIIKDFNFFVTK